MSLLSVTSDTTLSQYEGYLYLLFDAGVVSMSVETAMLNDYGEWRFSSYEEEMFSALQVLQGADIDKVNSMSYQAPSKVFPEITVQDCKDNSLAMGDFDWSNFILIPQGRKGGKVTDMLFVVDEYSETISYSELLLSSKYTKKQKQMASLLKHFVSSFY